MEVYSEFNFPIDITFLYKQQVNNASYPVYNSTAAAY